LSYQIEFSPDALAHLHGLTARQRAIVLDGVEDQLSNQPTTRTRNRKPLRPNALASWELRVGNLRVYYDTIEEEPRSVRVRAIGVKERTKVFIGGKEIEL
jgi:mRNA-degrading endonuclease RelE of RelBE toxin-antitoxin system